ncbi:MAG: sulfide/dihydroorotate dehydrogenase-like FAD/NAD-binding protein [Candidatus Latescibacteria bacterium]|jgi:ferredoxin/flavodoxin---NADP+ reductase|nr:sulfide/dihydroorotate dehydrogenase-like FAD/NAD-binding protein [Candidatus Latescibacterota bacterium]
MYKILKKKLIAPGVTQAEIVAPEIAKKRKAGQFVIIRFHEKGERIPLTIADADTEKGTITIISQRAGKSTAFFENMNKGDSVIDVVGPLGHPTHIKKYGHVVFLGGGIGIAPIHPIAQAMKKAGNRVTSIIGGKTKDFVILEDWMRQASDAVYISTDDGSYGNKGFVTDVLKELVEKGEHFDLAVVIGPVPMMKAAVSLTKEMNIPTIVSLNAIMVDGTGMCGGCRVSVGGETKFTCVDGPEFDGHQVDFKELMLRLRIFDKYGKQAMELYESESKNEKCVMKKVFDDKE